MCRDIFTSHGEQRGIIEDLDILVAIDLEPIVPGADNLLMVRKSIVGHPGSLVTIDLERPGSKFRYQVKLIRSAPRSVPAAQVVETRATTPSIQITLCNTCNNSFNPNKTCAVCPLQSEIQMLQERIKDMGESLQNARDAAALCDTTRSHMASALTREDESRRLLALEHKALRHWCHRRLNPVWLRWDEYVFERVRFKSKSAQVVAWCASRMTAKASGKWCEAVCKKRRALRSLKRWGLRSLCSAWKAWDTFVTEKQRALGVTIKVVSRLQNRVLALAWSCWDMMLIDVKHHRFMTTKIVTMWLGRAMSRSWCAWTTMVKDRKRLRALTAKCLGRWHNQALSRAFARWNAHAHEQKRDKQVTKRALGCWRNKLLHVSMLHWCQHASELKRMQNITERAMFRWCNKALAGTFVAWLHGSLETKRLRNMIARALKVWTNRALAQFFGKWNGELLRACKAKKALRIWVRGCESRAFHTWEWRVKEEQRMCRVVAKIICHWKHRLVALVWVTWHANHNEERRRRVISAKVVAQWVYRAVSRAWSKWWHERVRTRKALRVAALWQQRTLARGFAGWDDSIVVAKAQAQRRNPGALVSHSIARWQNMCVAAGWKGWLGHHRHLARLRYVAKNVILKWIFAMLSCAWQQWCNECVRTRKALKCLGLWQRRTSARVWRSWCEGILDQLRLGRVAAQVLGRLKHRTESQAFLRWTHENAQIKRFKAVTARVVHRWIHAVLSRAWETWWSDLVRARKAIKVVALWAHGAEARCWRCWVMHVDDATRLRVVGAKVLRHWTHRLSASAFQRLCEHHGELQRLRSVCTRVVQRWTHRALTTAWGKWLAELFRACKVLRILNLWKNKVLASGFNTWRLCCLQQKCLASISQRVALRWASRHVSLAFDSLFDYYVEMVAKRDEVVHVVTLEMPLVDTSAHALRQDARALETSLQSQICECLHVPSEHVQVLLITQPHTHTHTHIPKDTSYPVIFKVLLTGVVGAGGGYAREASHLMHHLAQAAVSAKEPYVFTKEPYISANEAYVSANETDIDETYIAEARRRFVSCGLGILARRSEAQGCMSQSVVALVRELIHGHVQLQLESQQLQLEMDSLKARHAFHSPSPRVIFSAPPVPVVESERVGGGSGGGGGGGWGGGGGGGGGKEI